MADDFKWPDAPWPEQAWWEIEGSSLSMSDELIKFAAALASLGGVDSRSNSRAAVLAGMKVSRTVAYRHARSVSVKKLLTKAEQIKNGKVKPLTEAEIGRRLAEMVRSANDVAAVRAIELLDKRKAALGSDDDDGDPCRSAARFCLEYGIAAVPIICEIDWQSSQGGWNPSGPSIGWPVFGLAAPYIKNRFPEMWERFRGHYIKRIECGAYGPSAQADLDEFDAAGAKPELTDAEFKKGIEEYRASLGTSWTELNRNYVGESC